MPKIGEFNTETLATGFANYLYTKGFSSVVEPLDGEVKAVWVHDEDAVVFGREALSRYLADPAAPEFSQLGSVATDRRREERLQEASHTTHPGFRKRFSFHGFTQGLVLTRLLILLSVVATVFGGLGSGSRLTQLLSMTEYSIQDGQFIFNSALPEIAHGQIWRLITPIFVHVMLASGFGVLHLLFNMLWLRDLGGMLEKSQGARGLLAKVLVIGVFSNVFQFAEVGPAFGGMSGVVYGLLGYIWVRGRLDLTSGLYVSSQTMLLMTFWFILCLSGTMGPVANAAHAGGLISGVLWGWLAARRVNARR